MDQEMIAEYLRLNIPVKDEDFDKIYPPAIRQMSGRHFTEVEVAIKAAELLVTKPKQKILDIGSGVGKFCFVGGAFTDASYTGVDYRKHFVDLCKHLTIKHRFKNVSFIHEDIMNIDFTQFDCFYFFNSFQEHTDITAVLDDTVEVKKGDYVKYSSFLKEQFEKMKDGTRIVTYHVYQAQIPDSYRLVSMHFDRLLHCWEKTSNPLSKLM